MSIYEQISMLFVDEFCACLVLLNNEPIIFPSMLLFGGYNFKLLLFVSTIARACSAIANYMLGRVIYNVFIKFSQHQILQHRYAILQKTLQKYGIVILCGCFIPVLGNVITLISGIARYNILYTTIYFAASSLIYLY